MSAHVKYLPDAAKPPGGVAAWDVADAERWRKAAVPAVFAPTPGAWALLPLVLTAIVLLVVSDPAESDTGTDWLGYPAAVLLTGLPLWYRLIPAATAVAAPLLALDTAFALTARPAGDTVGLAAGLLILALCGYAGGGALLRLRARRRQRDLALAAA
ncbi:hypothetical protein GPJ59_25755, partial [Streptomyces bambusae]|nr:hypothetical protein [Streptomyces bambusae]